jgi:hypothetical protein
MENNRELFLNKDLRCGGFYELSIQVCPSTEQLPITLFNEYVWNLPNVEGPYNSDYEKVELEAKPWMNYQGIINLDNHAIPFKTINIREDEPIETGYNWFDICFYAEAVEVVFGREYNTWEGIPNPPEILKKFLMETATELYKIHQFKLGLIGFEVSGQYYLVDLEKNLEPIYYTEFIVGKENLNFISTANRKKVSVIE